MNLTGVFLCMKYEIPRMLASGGGAIVNASSSVGLVGDRTYAGSSTLRPTRAEV